MIDIAMLHCLVCAMKPMPQIIFSTSCTPSLRLLFSPSTLHPKSSLSCTFPSCTLTIIFKICHTKLRLSLLVYSGTKHTPSNSCTTPKSHHSGPLFLPCCSLPTANFPSFQLGVDLHADPLRALTLPWHLHLLTVSPRISCNGIARRCTPLGATFPSLPFLSTAIHFSFGFGLKNLHNRSIPPPNRES